MKAILLYATLYSAFAAYLLASCLFMVRLFKGPHSPDRILALDAFTLNLLLILTAYQIYKGSFSLFDASLLIALFGFVSTVAMGRFLLRGEVIEP